MTIYINWMLLDAPIRGDAISANGNTSANDYDEVTSGQAVTAPEGANYAEIISDAAYKFIATGLSGGKADLAEQARLAGQCGIVWHIKAGTQITVTEL